MNIGMIIFGALSCLSWRTRHLTVVGSLSADTGYAQRVSYLIAGDVYFLPI
jgi:hypothetical protein